MSSVTFAIQNAVTRRSLIAITFQDDFRIRNQDHLRKRRGDSVKMEYINFYLRSRNKHRESRSFKWV
jgi:hypothetical protein